jgi:NADPH-dependent 2,4-dienoyl-CoA reductase/sulfur reductase-like enzyme
MVWQFNFWEKKDKIMNMISGIYKNIIVIGANSAGLAAANQARRINEGLDIKVFESGNYISYGSCSLSYYISGIIEKIDSVLNYPPQYFREKRDISVFTRQRVNSVNTLKKEIIVNTDYEGGFSDEKYNTVYNYDRLIICSGASPAVFNIEGIQSKNFFHFRSVEDAINIRSFIEKNSPGHAVITGGGYIGLLAAEALLHRGLKVSIVELKDNIFSDYEAEISGIMQAAVTDAGVSLLSGSRLSGINSNSKGICYCVTVENVRHEYGSSFEIDADIVIMAAGIKPNTSFLKNSSVELDSSGAIKVSQRQQSSQPNIFAAGDCCLAKNIVTKSYAYFPTAGNAIKSGRVAGANAAGQDDIFAGSAGTQVDKIFGYEFARTGIGLKEATEYRFNAIKVTGQFSSHVGVFSPSEKISIVIIVDKNSRRLLGAQMAGKAGVGKRIDVFAAAITAEMTVDDLYMTDTSYAPYIATVPDAVNAICGKAVLLLKK